MPPIANHGSGCDAAGNAGNVTDQIQPGRRPARLRRGGPARADRHVVHAGLQQGRLGLGRGVAGASDEHVCSHQLARDRDRQVTLPQVQHVGARRVGDVGPVVHRDERTVPIAGRPHHGECGQFIGGLEPLVSELDHIDAAGQDRVQESSEVTWAGAGVGAQVEAGPGQPSRKPGVTGGHESIRPTA